MTISSIPLRRLRQCCCHLSLLTSALRHNEGDQDDMDLELAMGSLSLGGGGGTAGGREEAEDKGGANGGGSYRYGATVSVPPLLVRLSYLIINFNLNRITSQQSS